MKNLTIEQFNKLSKRKKKILVAEDILAQIATGKYIAEKGNYISLYTDGILKDNDDIKENFDKIKECNVCMIGSAVMSITKFANKLTRLDTEDIGCMIDEDSTIEKIESTDKITELFSSVFSPKEAAMMEYCFEGETANFAKQRFGYILSKEEKDICGKFFSNNGGDYYEYDFEDGDEVLYYVDEGDTNSEELMIAICNNIIKNGAFKPELV